MKTTLLKRTFATFFLISSLISLSAQDGILASAGDDIGLDGTESYQLGRLAYNLSKVNENAQQSLEVFALGVDNVKEINLTVSAYPNPATSYLILELENPSLSDVSFQLFDTQGEVMHEMAISQAETQIDLGNLASAIYLLRVVQNEEEIKTFKIIKR